MAEASECRPRRGAAAAGLHGRGRGREGGWGVRRGSASGLARPRCWFEERASTCASTMECLKIAVSLKSKPV